MERHSFTLEHLEDRALFCVVAPMDAAPVAASTALHASALVRAASHNPLSGAFNIAGTYRQPLGNPDVGPQYDFYRFGPKAAFGQIQDDGACADSGFYQQRPSPREARSDQFPWQNHPDPSRPTPAAWVAAAIFFVHDQERHRLIRQRQRERPFDRLGFGHDAPVRVPIQSGDDLSAGHGRYSEV